MEYRSLGHSNLKVSSLGLGCVTFGREIDREASFEIMDHAFASGVTLFDTAAAYGGGASESIVGEWLRLRDRRHEVVLATKVTGQLSREWILESVHQSLERLQTDCIDLLQTHVWDDSTPFLETLEALTQLVEEGKVRHIGCSNYSADQLDTALTLSGAKQLARMTSVQPPYNLVQREIEADLIPLCQREQIGIISYSPLAAGFLTGKHRRGEPVVAGSRFDVIPGHQSIYLNEHGFSVLDELDKQAAATGRTHIDLALSWVLQQPGVTSVLFGARNTQHVDQAINAQQSRE